ncbi:MAG: MgtC/SapB family protein [Nanoarchaeota archaeon]
MDTLISNFLVGMILSVMAGILIGFEREARGKDAGIRTMALVICGSMLFTFLSLNTEVAAPSRIAAQIVTGIGFLGAGIIFHRGPTVRNLTTAATVWFGAAIGMAFGFKYYLPGIIGAVVCFLIPWIPHYDQISKKKEQKE